MNLKKFLILSVLIGLAIPVFAHQKEFYYLALFAIISCGYFYFKKRSPTLIDLLILILITIPLHTFRLGTEENFIRLSEIAFLPLFFWWLAARFLNKAKEPIKMRKEFLLLIGYLVINIASLKNSMLPVISIKRIMILAYLFVFTYIICDALNSKNKINTITKSMIVISGLSGIIALLQCIFPQLLIFNRVPIGSIFGVTLYRAGVGWHDTNYYAIYIAMNATLTLSYILSSNKNSRFLKLFFALQIIGLLATFSRTVIMSLILSSLYVLNYFGKKRIVITSLIAIMVTVGLVASSYLFIYKQSPFLASVVYRVADKQNLEKQPTLIMGHRYAAFIANWDMFIAHPVLGVGPFMAMYNFDKYRPAGYKYPIPWLASHNQYLQLLAEKGIFGFILFIWFLFMIIKNTNRAIKKSSDTEYKASLIGLKASIFVCLIASLALETSYELQFWLTCGIIMAIVNLINKEADA